MGHNRNLADYAHHFDGTNIDLGSGNIETEGVVTYEDVTNVDSVGIITARAGVKVPDNQKVLLGTGDDLEIFHDGTNTHISNSTGGLFINQYLDDGDIYLRTDDGSGGFTNYVFCDGSSGRVVLSYYGSGRIQTSSTGATVSGTLVSDSVTSELDLSAISASISDTAVDVFVYDTRKDSDGGAWRKRTQHTSWYNETLNTSTRGSRKEFPAVAVIVSTSSGVIIYDGDDPDLPMWMIFEDTLYDMINTHNLSPSSFSLSAKNGNLLVGSYNPSYGEANVINFISDSGVSYYSSHSGDYDGNISQRNDGLAQTINSNYGTLVNNVVKDVAITVLPNAPIDDATGLPVPTIAVATNGGVSVIKDDKTIVDSGFTGGVNYLSFSENGDRLFVSRDDSRVFTSSNTSSISADGWGNDNEYFRKDASNTANFPWINEDSSGPSSSRKNVRNVYGSQYGITVIDETPGVRETGMGAWIASDYNTGWMQGDIKGAFLSDTDTTNITGTNIIDNGDFGSNFTNWSIGGDTTPTISSGGAKISTAATIDGYIWQSTSGEAVGGKWVISWTLTANTSGFVGLVINGTQPANGSSYSTGGTLIKDGITASGSHYYDGTITAIEFRHRGGGGGHAIIDNITFKRVDEDRSVYNKGLEVYGTVTKSAVATGAELVAYSGFSASNHLAQPYNSDLNPGSGSYSVVLWFKTESNNSGSGMITGLGNNDGDEVMLLYVNSSYGIYFDYGSGSEYVYLSNSTDRSMVRDGNWHQVVCQVTAGQIGEIYIDGIKKSTAHNVASPSTWSQWDTNYRLYIGCGRGLGNLPFSGSISLVRYSLSKISTEQIKKIYEDEKVLFQENAKATLYGSSDAVTALAYDEDTELLHVGTSAGRSDFQGLRRINNTTTAVTTAISASDELIAEQ